ncbi:MAG: hypothetical protein ACR2II_07680 [Chthoniobacterales bacterium]
MPDISFTDGRDNKAIVKNGRFEVVQDGALSLPSPVISELS